MNRNEVLSTAQGFISDGEDASALPLLLPLVERGDIEAQLMLGIVCLMLGERQSGMEWLARASEAGSGNAAHNLGVALLVDGRFDEARAWLMRSHDSGYEATIFSDPLWFGREAG